MDVRRCQRTGREEGLKSEIESPLTPDQDLLDLREEIGHDTVEEFEIVLEELGNVDVPDGTQTDQRF